MQIYVRIARYTLEKDSIAQHSNSFGLTIPANLLMYYSKSLAKFIIENPRPFFIDPVTYIFVYPRNMLKRHESELQVDQEGNYKLKKSYDKLVRAYDKGLIDLFKSDNPLPISYFDDPDNVEKFVRNNIAYQKNLLTNSLDKISRYEAMAGEEIPDQSNLKPEFLTAPYFYFRNSSDPWYKVNINLSQLTKEFCPNDNVYSVICTDKQSLSSTLADEIVSDFDEVDGYLLFASNFEEYVEPIRSLRRLKSFVTRLYEESSKPIVNLYGNFFSVFLNYYGMKGVSSGLCVLDHKDVSAEVTMAIARIKFYLPSIRGFLVESDYRTYLERFNPSDECDCNLCRALANKKTSLSTRSYVSGIDNLFSIGRGELMTSAMDHFLHCRLNESELVNTKSLSEIRAILETNRRTSRRYVHILSTSNFVDRILRI